MKEPTILIFGIDEILLQNLKSKLINRGFRVIEAPQNPGSVESCQTSRPDLVIICSVRRTPGDQINKIQKIRSFNKKVPVILITRYSSEERAIAVFKAGANDYLKAPLHFKQLEASIKRHLSDLPQGTLTNNTKSSNSSISNQPLIGQSPAMREIKAYIQKVASSDSTVLITGETGTGKELATLLIHRQGPICNKPLVCVNCAAVPDGLVESELFGYEKGAFTGAVASKRGKFELANGGTLFLDEIGEMGTSAQAKMLRMIEEKENFRIGGKDRILIDVRIIAATNKDPERLIAEGKFRKDLYYRLNVARIHLPPLRERKEDISRLITYFIHELNQRFRREVEFVTEDSMKIMLSYDWPGNVRELKNLLEATFINLPSRAVTVIDLPEQFKRRINYAGLFPQGERERVVSALLSTDWNKSMAARKLNWSRMTLYRKIAKYHIEEESEAVEKKYTPAKVRKVS
jgi:DNA-binding NtrC family response regulator